MNNRLQKVHNASGMGIVLLLLISFFFSSIGCSKVEPLIAALKDENSNVRGKAALALGQIGAPAVEPLIAALKNNDLEIIFAAYSFYITRGEKDSEAVLIKVLNKYGTKDMAQDFLNCGNSLLENAGREWAKTNGYSIKPGSGSSGAIWGNSQ